jgi:hypothetical protein
VPRRVAAMNARGEFAPSSVSTGNGGRRGGSDVAEVIGNGGRTELVRGRRLGIRNASRSLVGCPWLANAPFAIVVKGWPRWPPGFFN